MHRKHVSAAMVTFLAVCWGTGCEEQKVPPYCNAAVSCPEGWLCRPNSCGYHYVGECYRPQPEEVVLHSGCVLNNRCEPEHGETEFFCPEECQATCARPSGSEVVVTDFIVSELVVLSPGACNYVIDVSACGFDFNGDSRVDNKIGTFASLLHYLPDDQDPDRYFADLIASGALALAVRVWSAGGLEDPTELSVQILPARVVDGTPLFDGGDVLEPLPEASTTTHLCVTPDAAGLYGRNDRDTVVLPMPLATGTAEPVFVASEHVRLLGQIEESGFHDVTLGGVVRADNLKVRFYPRWQAGMNGLIQNHPESEAAQAALDFLDDNCEWTLPGCAPLPDGCALDGRIAESELWCNALLSSAASPELSEQCDGTREFIGFGVRISGVPASVVSAD